MAVLDPDNSDYAFNADAEWFTISYKYNIESLLVKIDPTNPDKVDQELLSSFKTAVLAISKQLHALSQEKDSTIRKEKTLELKNHLTDLLYHLVSCYATSRTLICQLLAENLPSVKPYDHQ